MKPLETVAESDPDVADRVFSAPQVDIVVPVKNEERDLGPSVRRLSRFLREEFPFSARITIADNGSTDHTWSVATELSGELPGVSAVHMDQPGRGRALRAIWSGSDADVLAYMDVDLSTDLNALLPLVAPLLSGHSDVAIGTRLARGSRVVRGPRREVISRSYNLLLRASLGAEFSDAQCGFKAIRRDQARALLPLTEDTGWFFDTELLVLAERAGLRIHEVPVDWIDDTDSRVDIVATALADLRGIARLSYGLLRGTIKVPTLRDSAAGAFGEAGYPRGRTGRGELGWQIAGFTAIGVASTVAYLLLYLLLRSVMADQAANALSLLITAVANTTANRRLTFGIRGRAQAARHQFKGLIAFGIGLALTSGSLAALNSTSAGHSRSAEVSALVVANLVATVIRFVLFRSWVFGARRAVTASAIPSAESDGSMS
jgi:putative flippase GtrA